MLYSKPLARGLATLASGVMVSAIVSAGERTFTTEVTDILPPDTVTLNVPQFNPDQGDLTGVRVVVEMTTRSELNAENTSPAAFPIVITQTLDALIIRSSIPNFGNIPLDTFIQEDFGIVPAFDGTVDFRGASGRMSGPVSDSDSACFQASFSDPDASCVNRPLAGLEDVFVGDGTVGLDFAVNFGTCDASGPPNVVEQCIARVDVRLTIIYETEDGECPKVNRRRCASLLLFPEFDNRHGVRTIATVTNKNKRDDVCVHYIYVGRKGRDGEFLDCEEFDRLECLTPNDTLTVMTNKHNPQQEQGFFYAYAVDEDTHEAIIANDLIGHLLVVDGLDAFEYAINPVDYRAIIGPGEERGDPTDKDMDGVRDLNGTEYENSPCELLVPRFIGQGDRLESKMIFIGLSGGAQFTTTADILLFNDDEQAFSANHTFRCWDKVRLTKISQAFKNDFLKTTDDDNQEKLGPWEYGWIRVKGRNAHSTFKDILDPAIYVVLIEIINKYAAADLPFELCHNKDGHLFPRTLSGDNEE